MVQNLRQLTEADLANTLEGDFALPVELIGPGGIQNLTGQILYDTVSLVPETGETVITNEPIVTLRRSSLNPVPKDGEKWSIKIPTSPSPTASMENFVIDGDRASEGGASIGFIRLYLRRAVQEEL